MRRKNAVKHKEFKCFNYDHGNSSDFIANIVVFVKIAEKQRKHGIFKQSYIFYSTFNEKIFVTIY